MRDLLVAPIRYRVEPGHVLLGLRGDNGSEFIATKLMPILKGPEIETLSTEPGSPSQDVYGEIFNGRLRDELLNAEIFENLRGGEGPRVAVSHGESDYRPQVSIG